jgi:hypothetical protein
MKQYIIRLIFKVDASGLKKQLQSISKEAARVGAAMAQSMNRAFKTVAKQGSNASKQVVKSLDSIDVKAKKTSKSTRDVGEALLESLATIGAAKQLKDSIDAFARLESGLVKLQSAAQLFGKDFDVIKKDLLEIRKEGTLSFETLNYVSRQLLTPAFGLASDQVGEFVKGLRNIAAVEGIYEDLDFALTSFVRGLQTGTAELLENLSPRIRAFIQTEAGGFAKVQKDQAARQKLFNEIFRASTELQAQYERQLDTTALRQKVLNQRLLEAAENVGDVLNPAFKTLLGILTSLVEGFNFVIGSLSTFQKNLLAASVAAAGLAQSMKILTKAFALFGRTIKPIVSLLVALGGGIATYVAGVIQQKDALEKANEEFEKYSDLLEKIKKEDPTGRTLDYQRAQIKLAEATFEVNKQLAQQLGLEGQLSDDILTSSEATLAEFKKQREEVLKEFQAALVAAPTVTQRAATQAFGAATGVFGPAGPQAAGKKAIPGLESLIRQSGTKAFSGATERSAVIELAKDLLKIEKAIRKLTGVIADIGGGGTATPEPSAVTRVNVAGTLPSVSSRLSLTRAGREVELIRETNATLASIEAVRNSTKAKEELSKSLKGTVTNVEEYLDELEREAELRKEIAEIEEVNKVLGGLESGLSSLGTVIDQVGKSVSGSIGAFSSFAKSLSFLPGTLGATFGGIGSGLGIFSGLTSIFEKISSPSSERMIEVNKEQLRVLNEQLDIQKEQAGIEKDYFENIINSVRADAEYQKSLIMSSEDVKNASEQTRDEIIREKELGIERATSEKIRSLIQERLRTDFGFTGALTPEELKKQIDVVRETSLAAVGASTQFSTYGDVVNTITSLSPSARQAFQRELEKRTGGGFGIFGGNFDQFIATLQSGLDPNSGIGSGASVNLTPFLNEIASSFGALQSDAEKQADILDLIQRGIDSQIDITKLGNEDLKIIAENTSLQQVQPRGFGAVDVSRGGLAFGRDFIPTAASLISNVGVPAQIGNLAVAAEANKTMDQKMLDSLQNQLIELKAQTNLLAQLTNTDARIVIANAQAAVKATGF